MERSKRNDVERRRQLLERLGAMNARMRRLETEVDSADNVTRFHMERHLQSVSELLVDVNARAVAMPAEAGAPRQLERDVAAAEDELAAVEAKLVAVRAEARGDTAGAVRADLRAKAAWGSALRDELTHRPQATGQDERKGVRTTTTETLIAATYALEYDAIADYEDVQATFGSLGIRDTFDAAVLSRRADGRVHIVKSVEEPTRHGAVAGLSGGLAVGALVALFPAIAIGPGLALGGATGTVIGATAAHVARGMTRRDLEDLGELLGSRESGLVVVADAEMTPRAEAAITRAKTVVKKQVEFDAFGLKTEIESL
jgi:uncharacterized membrane protein